MKRKTIASALPGKKRKMIRIHCYKDGEIRDGTINDISPDSTLLIDLHDPTDEEMEIISLKTGILLEEMHIALDEEERPRAIELDNKALIIFKAPYFEDGNEITTTSVAIFVNSHYVLVLHKNRIDALDRMMSLPDASKKAFFSKGTVKILHRILDEITRTYFSTLDEIEDNIDKTEDDIMAKPDKVDISLLFETKKTLIYFHKALSANRDVMLNIERDLSDVLDKQELKRFRNIYNDIIQLIDTAATYREIITGTHNFYLSAVSNNLNLQMKKMTVYASFILVPTLITGIYGMNFAYMPEIKWYLGYPFAIGLMILSVLLLYWYFGKKGWL